MRANRRWLAGRIGLVVIALAGCQGEAERVQRLEPLEPEVRAAIDTAFHNEQYAENVFLRVLSEHGYHPVFMRWLYGEIQHTSRLAHLYLSRGLEAPVARWNITNVPSYPTIQEACDAAVELEERSVALYDRYLAELTLPPDVERTFRFIRHRSSEHIDSFEQCST